MLHPGQVPFLISVMPFFMIISLLAKFGCPYELFLATAKIAKAPLSGIEPIPDSARKMP
jgi:hypothetical protein